MFGSQKRKNANGQVTVPFLQIRRKDRVISRVQLSDDESIFAGTSATCKVELFGEEINSFHCMFCVNDGQLTVNNCSNSARTLLNGRPLEGETALDHGDQVMVGETVVVPVLREDAEFRDDVDGVMDDIEMVWPEQLNGEGVTEPSDEAAEDAADAVEQEFAVERPETQPVMAEQPEFERQADLEEETVQDVVSEDESGWVGKEPGNTELQEPATDEWCDNLDEPLEEDAPFEMDEELQQELELLRSEIEYLRCEVQEKDALLADRQDGGGEVFSGPDEEEVGRLVTRLEDLLTELQLSDDRVSALNDQLRAAEQANQAEQEERRQLETWLNEIESRVSQREAEMEGERQRLEKKWQAEQEQRAQAEKQVKRLMSRKPGQSGVKQESESESMLQDKLQQESRATESLKHENEELKGQLQRLQEDDQAQQVKSLQQKLAQLELESSRERAEIARQRVELERVRDELQRRSQQDATGDVDTRITAMRQHLREIYEEEKTIEIEKKQNSLSGRISRLLGKL